MTHSAETETLATISTHYYTALTPPIQAVRFVNKFLRVQSSLR